ncbi:MAG: hypothetical protein HY921_04065 [Elusimicrobia bacterium]|nr:hypothetical protein [Elusimicrobiota bacterium]
MPAADRKDYLQRLIMGLEQSIETLKFEIPYYKPGDIQLIYAKKFLAAAEENLSSAQAELQTLLKSDN